MTARRLGPWSKPARSAWTVRWSRGGGDRSVRAPRSSSARPGSASPPDPSCQTLVEPWLNQSLTTARSIPCVLAAVETDDEFLYSLHRAALGNVVEET